MEIKYTCPNCGKHGVREYVIHQISGDPLADRIENYEMLIRAEHIERHREEHLEIKRRRFSLGKNEREGHAL